jgi:hypothetical protein
MRVIILASTIGTLIGGQVYAAPCTVASIKDLREKTQIRITAKDHKDAADAFEEFNKDCFVTKPAAESQIVQLVNLTTNTRTNLSEAEIDQYYWLQSDGMLAQLKAGKIASCLSTGEIITKSYYMSPFLDREKTRPAKAIKTNLAKCWDIWDSNFKKTAAKICPLKIDSRSGKSYVIPAGFLPTKSRFKCIQWVDSIDNDRPRDDLETEDTSMNIDAFPHFRLIGESKPLAKLISKRLSFKGVRNYFDKCGIEHFEIGKYGRQNALHIKGRWGFCLGGTASGLFDAFFEFNGDNDLKLIDVLDVAYH